MELNRIQPKEEYAGKLLLVERGVVYEVVGGYHQGNDTLNERVVAIHRNSCTIGVQYGGIWPEHLYLELTPETRVLPQNLPANGYLPRAYVDEAISLARGQASLAYIATLKTAEEKIFAAIYALGKEFATVELISKVSGATETTIIRTGLSLERSHKVAKHKKRGEKMKFEVLPSAKAERVLDPLLLVRLVH